LRAVRDQVGKETFDDILKDYYTAETYKITTPDAFFDAVARHSEEDLRGVVKAYFAGSVVLPCKLSANEPGCRP
jgi:aminopeptidase N